MSGWTTHMGRAVCLDHENIDTDQLIPARFMSQPRVEGYGDFLLYDLRRHADGTLRTDFILNQHPTTTVLLAGKNFGSGSSREAAIYALLDSGIKVIIAERFGDIFSSNAVNNGVLPALICASDWQTLRGILATSEMACEVDLQASTLTIKGLAVSFNIDETWRQKLINGWDDIDLTKEHQSRINGFRNKRYQQQAWTWPTTHS